MSTILIGILGLSTTEIFLIVLFSLIIFLIPKIFYLLTLQRAMEKVSEPNRTMPPGRVWIELIPLVNLVWQFINVENITKSLEREFHTQEKYTDIRSTANIGKAYCILYCCSYLPILSSLAGIAALICWIVFWVRIADLKNQL